MDPANINSYRVGIFAKFLPGRYFYAEHKLTLADGTTLNSCKELVVAGGWLATALAAWRGQVFVPSKVAYAALYRQYVYDNWTSHVDDLMELVREKWHYIVPESFG